MAVNVEILERDVMRASGLELCFDRVAGQALPVEIEAADDDVARVTNAHGVAAVSAGEDGWWSRRGTFDVDAGACGAVEPVDRKPARIGSRIEEQLLAGSERRELRQIVRRVTMTLVSTPASRS